MRTAVAAMLLLGCGSPDLGGRDGGLDLSVSADLRCPNPAVGGDPMCPCEINGGEPCSGVGGECYYYEAWVCTCEARDAGSPSWSCVDQNALDFSMRAD